MFYCITLAFIIICLFNRVRLKNCERWFRWVLVFVYFRFIKRKLPLFNFDAYSNDLSELGIKALPEAIFRENPRALPDNIHAIDSVKIWGANKNGAFLYLQINRRHDRVSEVSIYFRDEDGEEYELPIHPDTNVYNTDGKSFTAAGLNFEVLEPLRKWRVNYSGHFRRLKDEQIVDASFNFLWIPASCYVSFPEDFNPRYLATYLSDQSRMCPSKVLEKLSKVERYENSGQLHGLLKINEFNQQLLLRGFKVRSHGYLDRLNGEQLIIEAFLDDGSAVKLFMQPDADEKSKPFLYGYVLPPCNMAVLHICHFYTDPAIIYSLILAKLPLDIKFTAGNFEYHLLTQVKTSFRSLHGDEWQTESNLNLCSVTLNNGSGTGVIEILKPNHGHFPLVKRRSMPLLTETDIKITDRLVVTFDDVECRSSQLVGGKAASLALMSSIINHSQQKFVVPSAVSVTNIAWQIQQRHNPNIEAALMKLRELASSGNIRELEQQCNYVVSLISLCSVSTGLKDELLLAMETTFGDGYGSMAFAVRSSAIGEDGEEMSAAGQNETYLGVKGTDEILKALSKCWASQFAFRSVEYKRQNAQLFNMGMGVVIQRMVPAEVAGVLFSTHPLTGSHTQMLITANYGLGESVVSASADPDTIVVRRDHHDILAVEEVTTGSKKSSIQMAEDGGTLELETEAKVASKCCLSEPMAIRLAEIAVFLEKCYGDGRDIEWAIHLQQIYILQSRPVTTNSSMTDFEIMHEFDTLSRTDNESYSTANLSEVFPGCLTPLSLTSILRGHIPYFQKRMMWRIDCYKYDPIVIEWMSCFCGHIMFDLINQKAWCTSVEKDAILKALDVGLFGRVLEDEDIIQMALNRFRIRPPLHKMMAILTAYTLKGMLFGGRMLKSSFKKYRNYRIPIEGTESMREVYEKIEKCITDVNDIMDTHLGVTFASTLWNSFILNILSSGKSKYTIDQYSDFAMIIGSCNGTESGNVPASLQELAFTISQSPHYQTFSTAAPQVALESLKDSEDNKVRQLFNAFMLRHGHRGMKECDMIGKTWGRQPLQVISVLQEMLKSTINPPKVATQDDQILENLKSHLTPFRKRLLRWMMGYCRQGICYREAAKSLFVKYINSFRESYDHLAKLMMRDGLLVEKDLIYFFTHEELGQFISNRSPQLLRRGKQRRRLYDYKDKLRFPEMMRGLPTPINDSQHPQINLETNAVIKGCPVSHGVIEGRARVVDSFHDVNTIQSGEILITHTTDIGWSPYFPMLSGVVTEIGGLISHGAVVAREFGIPCIVGVDNATQLFQSGDIVLLNATQGTIVKIQSA